MAACGDPNRDIRTCTPSDPAGIVFALGWWKVAAFIFPPYAWYLVVDKVLEKMGWK